MRTRSTSVGFHHFLLLEQSDFGFKKSYMSIFQIPNWISVQDSLSPPLSSPLKLILGCVCKFEGQGGCCSNTSPWVLWETFVCLSDQVWLLFQRVVWGLEVDTPCSRHAPQMRGYLRRRLLWHLCLPSKLCLHVLADFQVASCTISLAHAFPHNKAIFFSR